LRCFVTSVFLVEKVGERGRAGHCLFPRARGILYESGSARAAGCGIAEGVRGSIDGPAIGLPSESGGRLHGPFWGRAVSENVAVTA